MTPIDLTTVITHSDRQANCEIDDEAVVMDIVSQQFYTLNSTASAVWRLFEVPRPIGSVVDDLVERFDVEPQRCAREVCALVDRLVRCGIVDVRQPPAATQHEGAHQ